MSQDVTTLQDERVVADLQWAVEQVFEIMGTWASEADRSAIAVTLATASRHLSWHLADLTELLPAVEDEDEDDEPPPRHPGVARALRAVRSIPGSVERLGVAYRVLVPRLAVECHEIERLTKPDEEREPVVEVAVALLGDLRRDRDEGEALLQRLLVDGVAVDSVGERVVEAERRLVDAGGLVPVSVN